MNWRWTYPFLSVCLSCYLETTLELAVRKEWTTSQRLKWVNAWGLNAHTHTHSHTTVPHTQTTQ